MTRQFQVQDDEWGEYTLFVIHENEDGTWEDQWDVFRTDEELQEISDLFTCVSYEAYQDALRNVPLPLIKELGIEPSACFFKVQRDRLRCLHRETCAMHDAEVCQADATPPPCFEASFAEKEPTTRTLITRIFDMWREGFYIIVAPRTDFDSE